MHEESKVAEADYFLKGIAGAVDDPNATRYQASAFLTAARSVLQYAREEAMTRAGGQQWYDDAVVRDPLVKCLKDHRDINVHERPLPMRTHTTIEVGAAVLTFQSTLAATIIRGATGEQEHRVIKDPVSSSAPPVRVSLQADANPRYAYEFKDWPGSEDLLTLCRRYLDEIKRIVVDGRSRGFLTPY
jgi:hypothetical protein